MTFNFKEEVKKEDRFCGGHRMCAGCGAPITIKNVLKALNPEDKAVICSATSCLEVSTFMYPYTSWKDSFIHNAFEKLPFTNQIKYPEILFTKDTTKVYVYLKK